MRRRKFILALGAALLAGGIAVPVSAQLKPGLERAGVLYTPSNVASALAVKQAVETIPERLDQVIE